MARTRKVGKKPTVLWPILFAFALVVSMASCADSETTGGDTRQKTEGGSKTETADTIIKGSGNIYITSAENSAVDAIAIKDGKVIFAGSSGDVGAYESDATEVVELEAEQIALPGFIDGHAHGNAGGTEALFQVDLYTGTESLADYQKVLKDYIAKFPDLGFIRGSGWINGFAPEGGFTTAHLDEVLPEDRKNIPMALFSSDHHSYWVNSAALNLIYEKTDLDKDGKTTPNPTGGVIERDAQGKPTGVFRDAAQSYVAAIIPEYTVAEIKEGILSYQNESASYGITAYWDPMVGNLDNVLQAYKELEEEGKLLLRSFAGYQLEPMSHLSALDETQKLIDENKGGMFELKGVKIFADGVVEGHTAYLLDDYYDAPGRGEASWQRDKFDAMVAKADEMGITVHVHAIGDAAAKQAIDAFAAAAEANGTEPGKNRHAITHLQIVDPADIKRMAELGIVAVPDPYWFSQEPGYFSELEYPFLGPDAYDGKYPGGRVFSEYPMKAFFDAGIKVAMASDFPITLPARPLDGIETGVLRIDRYGNPASELNPVKNPENVKPVEKDGAITGFENLEIDPAAKQNVTVEQMLETAGYGSAYSLFCEDRLGTLEVGKEADIVVLDRNIYKTDPLEIGGNELPFTLPPDEAAKLGPADYGTNVVRTLLGGKTIFELPPA